MKFVSIWLLPLAQCLSREGSLKRIVETLTTMEKNILADGKRGDEESEAFNCRCFKIVEGLKANLAVWSRDHPALNESLAGDLITLGQLNATIELKNEERQKLTNEAEGAVIDRTKENKKNNEAINDLRGDIALTQKAIAALQGQPLEPAFLQSTVAKDLKNLVSKKLHLFDSDRKTVLAFLSQPPRGYANDHADQMHDDENMMDHDGMSEVVGILKQLLDDTNEELTRTTEAETAASTSHASYLGNVKEMLETLNTRIYDWQKQVADLMVKTAAARTNLAELTQNIKRARKAIVFNTEVCDKFKADAANAARLREEELEALREARKILASGEFEATKTVNTVEKPEVETPAFLQIKQDEDVKEEDTMTKIYKLIENMKVTLKAEKDKLVTDKTTCESKLTKLSAALNGAVDAKKENAQVIIDVEKQISTLREKTEGLKKQIWDLDHWIDTYDKECQEKLKTADNEWNGNKRDLEILMQAREVIQRYYNQRQSLLKVSQTQPEEVNFDTMAPPPVAYKKQSSGGVLGLFNRMVEEFKETIATNAKEIEEMTSTCKERSEDAQANLETARDTMKKTRGNLNNRLVQLDDAKEQQIAVVKTYTEAVGAKAQCETNCKILAGNFNRRMDEIENSMANLVSAKETLRSYQGSTR